MKRTFARLFVVGLICNVIAENPPPITTCIKDMSLVSQSEMLVTDTSIRRVYILCPNTVFSPGVNDPETGGITGGQEPLACKSNCVIRCGENGLSSNNCVIDGTGTFAIFQMPFIRFEDHPEIAEDIFYQGITIDFFVSQGQFPILVGSFFGDVTFQDCVFSNNSGDPLFTITQFQAMGSARTGSVDAPPAGYFWNGGGKNGGLRRNLLENVEIVSGPTIVHDNAASRRQLRATDILQTEGTEVITDGDRILQTTDGFKVSFQKCLFVNNSPVRRPQDWGGLSLVRFSGSEFYGTQRGDEIVGQIAGSFIDCRFKGNQFSFEGDEIEFRALVDFHSSGELTMKRNCFLNSTVKNYGVVVVTEGADITNEDNFVEIEQPELLCSFIVSMNESYYDPQCGLAATGTSCDSDGCFPGDATCDVQGKGEVMMRNLKLGDKVRVQGGKYEPVYSFGHHAPDMTNRYIKLVTSDRSLEVSKDHLVFVEGGRSVPASSIKVGDNVQLADGELASIVAIALTSKQGAYAPFTASGTVVVNGVTTSSFISLQGTDNLKIGGIDTGLSYHFLSHAFEAPHRMWCQYVSACSEEVYTPDGISLWAAAPHKWFRWYLVQDMITMLLLGVPVICILLCIAHPATALVTIAAVLFGFRHHSLRCKRH